MAQVDFTNARIAPAIITGFGNPTENTYLSINQQKLTNSSGAYISNGSSTQLKNESKQLVYLYQGTFSASGTEFYVITYNNGSSRFSGWKVSNITFSSGDTYVFSIKADLICQ